MHDHKRQDDRSEQAETLKQMQERTAKPENKQENHQDYRQLHKNVESWQQQFEKKQSVQEQKLQKEHEFLRSEWEGAQKSESRNRQDRPEEQARFQQKQETIAHFENFQREQLAQLEQLKTLTAQQQQQTIQGLEESQSEEMARSPNNQMQRQELESTQQQERNELDAKLKAEQDALDEYRNTLQFQMERDRGKLLEALYAEQNPLKEVLDRQETGHRAQTDKMMQQLSDLQQRIDEARNLLAKELNETRFSDEAVKRILVEAGSGLNQEQQKTEASQKSSLDRAKGQIFEELLKLDRDADVARRNSLEADRQLEFIAGDRIRMDNRKLTDGLLVRRDADNKTLYLVAAYEAKSGSPSSKELYRKVEELTQEGRKELERQARDLAMDQVFGVDNAEVSRNAELQAVQRRNVSEEQSVRIKELTDKFVTELLRYRVQAELGGQVQKTIERLSPDSEGLQRIAIDGREFKLAMDEDRNRAEVVKVLLEDVRRRDEEALRLKEQFREEQLKRAANSLFR
jgi:hypothetical protein